MRVTAKILAFPAPKPEPCIDPNARGYHIVYRDNEVNHCPGCGRSHWLVGRLTAECAFCGTALPLTDTSSGAGVFRTRGTAYAPTAMEEPTR